MHRYCIGGPADPTQTRGAVTVFPNYILSSCHFSDFLLYCNFYSSGQGDLNVFAIHPSHRTPPDLPSTPFPMVSCSANLTTVRRSINDEPHPRKKGIHICITAASQNCTSLFCRDPSESLVWLSSTFSSSLSHHVPLPDSLLAG